MDKLTNQIDVATFCKAHRLPGEIVGEWIWIDFPTKPADNVRQLLKAAGFRWSTRRAQWYHNCGFNRTGRGGPNPRSRYGSRPVDEIAA